MLEGVTGERRVVRLDVEPEIPVEPVLREETADCRGVEIVLVLRRLLRLRLYVKVAPKTYASRVFRGYLQEEREIVKLELHVGVEQRLVALSSAPVDVSVSAELHGQLRRLLYLRRRESEHVSVRGSPSAVHISRVREAVRRAPEELLVMLRHEILYKVADDVKPLV